MICKYQGEIRGGCGRKKMKQVFFRNKKGRRWCRHSMFWQANQTGMSQQPKSCVLGLGKAKQTKCQSGFSGNSHVLDLSKSSGAREDQGDTLYWRCLERRSLGVNNDMRRAKQTKHKQTSTNGASPNRTPRLHHPATWNIPSSRDPRYLNLLRLGSHVTHPKSPWITSDFFLGQLVPPAIWGNRKPPGDRPVEIIGIEICRAKLLALGDVTNLGHCGSPGGEPQCKVKVSTAVEVEQILLPSFAIRFFIPT